MTIHYHYYLYNELLFVLRTLAEILISRTRKEIILLNNLCYLYYSVMTEYYTRRSSRYALSSIVYQFVTCKFLSNIRKLHVRGFVPRISTCFQVIRDSNRRYRIFLCLLRWEELSRKVSEHSWQISKYSEEWAFAKRSVSFTRHSVIPFFPIEFKSNNQSLCGCSNRRWHTSTFEYIWQLSLIHRYIIDGQIANWFFVQIDDRWMMVLEYLRNPIVLFYFIIIFRHGFVIRRSQVRTADTDPRWGEYAGRSILVQRHRVLNWR